MTLTLTDFFAGAGGSSTGAAAVPGLTVTMAANHWNLAIEVHNENHPQGRPRRVRPPRGTPVVLSPHRPVLGVAGMHEVVARVRAEVGPVAVR